MVESVITTFASVTFLGVLLRDLLGLLDGRFRCSQQRSGMVQPTATARAIVSSAKSVSYLPCCERRNIAQKKDRVAASVVTFARSLKNDMVRVQGKGKVCSFHIDASMR